VKNRRPRKNPWRPRHPAIDSGVPLPGKKKPSSREPKEAAPSWQVILEEMASQNRATIEAVNARHEEMRGEVRSFRTEIYGQVSLLSIAFQGQAIDLRDLKTVLQELKANVASLDGKVEKLSSEVAGVKVGVGEVMADVRGVAAKVEGDSGLEKRVFALERKGA